MKRSLLYPFYIIILASLVLSGCKLKVNSSNTHIEEAHFTVDFNCPEFPQYPEFSRLVKESLEKDYNEYREEVARNHQYSPDEDFSYRTEFRTFKSGNFINLIVLKYLRASADSEDQYIRTYVWNKKSKSLAKLSDVTSIPLKQISSKCQDAIMSRAVNVTDSNRQMILDEVQTGTAPDPENYSAWTVKDGRITFYFESGTTLSSWYGMQAVELDTK